MQLDDTTLENISTFAYQWTNEIYSYDKHINNQLRKRIVVWNEN